MDRRFSFPRACDAPWSGPPDLVLDLPNDLASIEEAVNAVLEHCAFCGANRGRVRLKLRVGLWEALANAILYGNQADPAKRVRVEVAVRDSAITARITDQGSGFDPHSLPDPTRPENLLRPEGRGIFLMRKLLDEVFYNDQGNSVTLVVRIQEGNPGRETDFGARA